MLSSKMNEDAIIENLINKYQSHKKPPQDFLNTPEKSSVEVRSLSMAIKTMVRQQNKRFSDKIERVLSSVVYKRASQQRRQSYWKNFAAFYSSFRKYQDNHFVEILNTIDKKIDKFSSFFYLLTPEMILHIASLFLRQLYHLQNMKKHVLRLTNKLFGFFEINHFGSLSIFLIGLCAEVTYLIPEQTRRICDTYNFVAEFFQQVDPSFPSSLEDFDFVKNLLSVGSINDLPDTNHVLTMLNLNSDDLESVIIKENIKNIKKEIMENEASEAVDLGVSIAREEVEEVDVSTKQLKRKLSSVDSAIGTDLNTSVGSIADDEVFGFDTRNKKRIMKKKKLCNK